MILFLLLALRLMAWLYLKETVRHVATLYPCLVTLHSSILDRYPHKSGHHFIYTSDGSLSHYLCSFSHYWFILLGPNKECNNFFCLRLYLIILWLDSDIHLADFVKILSLVLKKNFQILLNELSRSPQDCNLSKTWMCLGCRFWSWCYHRLTVIVKRFGLPLSC